MWFLASFLAFFPTPELHCDWIHGRGTSSWRILNLHSGRGRKSQASREPGKKRSLSRETKNKSYLITRGKKIKPDGSRKREEQENQSQGDYEKREHLEAELLNLVVKTKFTPSV